MKRYLLYILFIDISFAAGQSVYISNPSFEGVPAKNQIPDGWTVCNAQSTPDLQPVEVTLAPTDGQSFLGLIMRSADDPSPKNEDIVTELLQPLSPDSVYILSVDLAYAPYLSEGDVVYNNIPQLRITGGTSKCVISQVFVVSNPINNADWMRYCFLIKPSSEITHLAFEIFAAQFQASYLVMDNLTLEPFHISGASHVCKGSQNQVYSFTGNCNSSISAIYTGTGATLDISGDQIIIDYDSDATSGDLVVEFINTESEPASFRFPISVDSGLPGSGSISGASSVCQGQTLEFFETDVTNTTIYNWRYTGTGAEFNILGSGVTIDFADNATGGTLILEPGNGCGSGTAISHNVAIVPLPANAGLISGDDQVCQGESVSYHINSISFATDYLWSYTGEGAALDDGTLDLQVSFAENATGGYLTVKGINTCGEGKQSLEFIIFMNEFPKPASAIEGSNEICPGSISYTYRIPEIAGATDYVWNYTGQGVMLSENTNQIQFDGLNDVTDGILTVSGRNACGTGTASPSFAIDVNEICNLTIPNAFSPNEDGINDRFVIQNLNVSAQLIVFERSGRIVYESGNYENSWDGRDKNGRVLPSDTYWYVITAEGFDKEIKGYVYLKR